jgi:hypothetical protein
MLEKPKIYIIDIGGQRIKIGASCNYINGRIAGLKSTYGKSIKLINVFEFPTNTEIFNVELFIHRRMDEFRVIGKNDREVYKKSGLKKALEIIQEICNNENRVDSGGNKIKTKRRFKVKPAEPVDIKIKIPKKYHRRLLRIFKTRPNAIRAIEKGICKKMINDGLVKPSKEDRIWLGIE